jgi:hypothetical protein
MPNARRALAIAALVAAVVPLCTLWFGTSALPIKVVGLRAGVIVFRILDAPTSALTALLPWSWRSGLAVQFASTPHRYEIMRYLVTGFSAYLLLGLAVLALRRTLVAWSQASGARHGA